MTPETDTHEQDEPIPLDEPGWETLLQNIRTGNCTPFIGAGACIPPLPSGAELASEWAAKYGYPLGDCTDLARVAQYLAVTRAPMYPKIEIQNRFQGVVPPDFQDPNEPHGLLADMPLPIYVTTNYDDFMVRALRNRNKEPKRELCRWNSRVRRQPSIFESDHNYEPTSDKPLVFHLHGYKEVPQSIVLTEDDYLDFLINLDRDTIPPRVEEAFSGASILFLGYKLADLNFRLLFRQMVSYMERSTSNAHVSVQLVPHDIPKEKRQQALHYLNNYFEDLSIRVYWGNCRQFTSELRRRWKAPDPASVNAGAR